MSLNMADALLKRFTHPTNEGECVKFTHWHTLLLSVYYYLLFRQLYSSELPMYGHLGWFYM